MKTSADPVEALYQSTEYPPMSHPLSDPAATGIAAWLGGLRPPPPAGARILEIGCASGHNLLPLALRWPASQCTGVDLSETAIHRARQRAADSGIPNATFIAADLRALDFPAGSFDYIIAHGVFSWIADEAKAALLKLCAETLSPSGIATISFNLHAGWEPRLPVIAAVRRIQSDHGLDEITALQILRTAAEDPETQWLIDDMLEKGRNLIFDDFAPVNDPWTFARFADACARVGLHWLGESDPSENIPQSLDEKARGSLAPFAGDPLEMQLQIDAMTARTFRSGVLCRADAPLSPRISTAIVLEMCVKAGDRDPDAAKGPLGSFLEILHSSCPQSLPVKEVLDQLGPRDVPAIARAIHEAVTRGLLLARVEPVCYPREPAAFPALDSFRLLCAREKLPLVDPWHIPCAFPDHHYDLLARMNGETSIADLSLHAAAHCPDLVFLPWLHHLAARGMFS